MDKTFPLGSTYEILYARFLQSRPPEALIAIALGLPKEQECTELCLAGMSVGDIGGGTGRLSLAALELGAQRVIMLEPDRNMASGFSSYARASQESILLSRQIELFDDINLKACNMLNSADMIFSQQSINYWFCDEALRNIACWLKPGGVFVFNTFNNKLPTKPLVKEYTFAGHHYVEVSWMTRRHPVLPLPNGYSGYSGFTSPLIKYPSDDIVNHVQICDGLEPHTTEFMWLPPDVIDKMLRKYFSTTRLRLGKTDTYRCTRL